jgi:hypothetical protein
MLRTWAIPLWCCVAGCTSHATSQVAVFETKLQAAVGQSFTSTEWSKPTGATVLQLEQTPKHRTIEYRWKNGCTFVIVVETKTDIISGWRFTENEAECRAVKTYTFGT